MAQISSKRKYLQETTEKGSAAKHGLFIIQTQNWLQVVCLPTKIKYYYVNELLIRGKASGTFPSGFMENGETAEEGAAREARMKRPMQRQKLIGYTLYSLPHINQVYLIFAGELLNPDTVKAGEEVLMFSFFPRNRFRMIG